jgi:hypothetical protein
MDPAPSWGASAEGGIVERRASMLAFQASHVSHVTTAMTKNQMPNMMYQPRERNRCFISRITTSRIPPR